MTDATLGAPIASGRAADVYAYREGLVLRRYRTPAFLLYEAAAMQHVDAHGYPVPHVAEASGPDLVMERLDGPTLLTDLGAKPWRLFRHAKTIAGLIHRLHEIPPPPWLVHKHERCTAIVHLDLHPDNVMLTSRGPVVIDWSNVGLGDPDTEVADLWLVLKAAAAPGGGLMDRVVVTLGRGLFLRALLSHFDKKAVGTKLAEAFTHRSRDRNMSEAELTEMRKLVARYEG
jgi:aminoglycoside phosphotransferase (APT) family kinase protein